MSSFPANGPILFSEKNTPYIQFINTNFKRMAIMGIPDVGRTDAWTEKPLLRRELTREEPMKPSPTTTQNFPSISYHSGICHLLFQMGEFACIFLSIKQIQKASQGIKER